MGEMMNKMNKSIALWALAVFCAALAAASCGGGDSPASADFAARRAAAQAMREGNDAFEREEYKDAMDAYDRAAESMPEDPRPAYNSANALYMQNRLFEAIDKYEDALKRAEPDLAADIYSSMCRAALESGDREGAVQSCESALGIDPDHKVAKRALEEANQADNPPDETNQPGPQGDQEPQPGGDQQQQQNQQQPGGGQPQQQNQQPGDGEPQPGGQPPQPGDGQNPPDGADGEPSQDQGGQPGEPSADPGTQSGAPVMVPPTGLTEEQARQLLEVAGDRTDTLPRRSWDDDNPIIPDGSRSGRDW